MSTLGKKYSCSVTLYVSPVFISFSETFSKNYYWRDYTLINELFMMLTLF